MRLMSYDFDWCDFLPKIAETAVNYGVVAAKRNSDAAVVPLSHHPFGRPLLNSIMKHLGNKLNEMRS